MPEPRREKAATGRPQFAPTPEDRETCEELSGLLVPHETIARIIGIDPKTLRRHFRHELGHGRERVVAKLKAVVYGRAKLGSMRACCYLLDRMLVWPEPTEGERQPVEVRIIGGLRAIASDQGTQ
jgi:hypothetical protein